MTEDTSIYIPLYEALEDTSWAINRGVLPTYSLLEKLSVTALHELESSLYELGAMMDAKTDNCVGMWYE
jgi:hypothetical protein